MQRTRQPRQRFQIQVRLALALWCPLRHPLKHRHYIRLERYGFRPTPALTRPYSPDNSGSGRRVVYKNNLQWVWIVDASNIVVRVFPVSGLRGVPDPGKYTVTSQSLRSFSLELKDVWFNHMTRFALGPHGGNIGFHAIPTKYGKSIQTEAQLGSFQGGGCIRVRSDDAKFIFQYAKLGTTVVVLP